MTDLSRIIGDLIATGKEGDHWDFKREPHAMTGDLIKDIICLANSPRHTGDRYIIYGVDDTGLVVGLQSGTRRTQADIVNTLSNAGFAGGVYPDIYLQQIELQGHRLEVLVIKDRPEKPYYLQKKYHKGGVRLNPGTVYARVRDSNTPSDQVASSYDIDRMWRQRFGLDQTPFQRVQNYLLDRDGWAKTSEDVWYYSQFPEFTISPTEEEARPVQAGENWVRAATNPSAFVRPFRICFHQTVLAQVVCILRRNARNNACTAAYTRRFFQRPMFLLVERRHARVPVPPILDRCRTGPTSARRTKWRKRLHRTGNSISLRRGASGTHRGIEMQSSDN